MKIKNKKNIKKCFNTVMQLNLHKIKWCNNNNAYMSGLRSTTHYTYNNKHSNEFVRNYFSVCKYIALKGIVKNTSAVYFKINFKVEICSAH